MRTTYGLHSCRAIGAKTHISGDIDFEEVLIEVEVNVVLLCDNHIESYEKKIKHNSLLNRF